MPTPGRTSVGRYELRERLGAGGMGTVWRAWDPSLQRDVAVKEVLLPEGMDPEDRAEARARTLREAQATARISNTSVVTIHDVLEHDDSPWIVMELLSGASMQHHLDQHGPMPPEQVEEAARSLLGGLRAAHAAGVTHRDVKPANIMLTDDGRTVLTDFGIANVDGSTALTQTGVYIGSPEYMAPERFEGERALPASDLWSLGVTLYSLLEGRTPFKRDSITGIISAVLTTPMPPALSLAGDERDPASRPLRTLIGALLDREVARRPDPTEALALLARERRAHTGRTASAPGTGPQSAPGGGLSAYGPAGPGGVGGGVTRRQETGPSGPYSAHRNPTGGEGAFPDTLRPGAPGGPTVPGVIGIPAVPEGSATAGGPVQGPPGHTGTSGGRPAYSGPAGPPRANPSHAQLPGGPGTANGPGTGGTPVLPGAHNTPHPMTARGPQPYPQQRYGPPAAPGTGYHAPTGNTGPGTGPGMVGTGFTPGTGLPPGTGGQGSWAPAGAAPRRPVPVVVAAVMLGINAAYLLFLTVMFGAEALGGDTDSWGAVLLLGLWGSYSVIGSAGTMLRSRLVFGAVVLGQGIAAIGLFFSLFSVLIYNPEQLAFYVLVLVFNVVIGGLLLIPARARAYFGVGASAG
ncbi:protein kinase [Nocardiopsis sp. NPDC058631]|uniref:serine/threonine-protein kinase n=1 Tax=Nocardiopsis sp. NPDC058631 TaxID=3346566 RepID=UPI003649D4E1